jgi:hypothetical protein
MELLSNARTEYTLSASLESLHAESVEWRKEVSFWQEELTFFYKLIHQRGKHAPFPSAEVADLEKQLIAISSGDLPTLMEEVENHEHFLASLLRNTSMTDENMYRQHHRHVLESMHDVHTRIRSYKHELFHLLRKH